MRPGGRYDRTSYRDSRPGRHATRAAALADALNEAAKEGPTHMADRTPTEITSALYSALDETRILHDHSIAANVGGPVLTATCTGEDGKRHRWHAAVLGDVLPGRFPRLYLDGEGFDVVGVTVREKSSGELHHWGVPLPGGEEADGE